MSYTIQSNVKYNTQKDAIMHVCLEQQIPKRQLLASCWPHRRITLAKTQAGDGCSIAQQYKQTPPYMPTAVQQGATGSNG
jgi:hypothetical protein